jgi:hypothetical protein
VPIGERAKPEPPVQATRLCILLPNPQTQGDTLLRALGHEISNQGGSDTGVAEARQEGDTDETDLLPMPPHRDFSGRVAVGEHHVVIGSGECRVVRSSSREKLHTHEIMALLRIPAAEIEFFFSHTPVEVEEELIVAGRGGAERYLRAANHSFPYSHGA